MKKALLVTAFLVVSAAMVLTTSERVRDWNDELTLWHEAVRLAPVKPRPLINYGNMALQRGLPQDAAESYRLAIVAARTRSGDERDHGAAFAQTNLAVIEAQAGRKVEALVMIRAVEQQYPRFLDVQTIRRRWEREMAVESAK